LRKLQVTKLCVSWQLWSCLNFFVLKSALFSQLPEVPFILIFYNDCLRQASLAAFFICEFNPRDSLKIVHPQRLAEINSVTLSLGLEHLATDPDWNAAEAHSQLVDVYPVRSRVDCLRSLFVLLR
jgi:hypothetical protein